MGSSTKSNSMATDLTDANNETGIVACDGLFIREKDPKLFWPFSQESASLVDKQSDSPSSGPKLKWWSSLGCTRNIDADKTNDSGLPSNSRSIISTKELNGSSSVIPSQSKPNSPTATDQENERNTDHVAGNAVLVNENVNCERSQKDDQRDNAVVGNEDLNCEKSQKDDQTDTRCSEKPFRTYALRNKNKRVAVPEPVGNRVEHPALTLHASAAVEVNTRTEEPSSKKESVRGKQRKSRPGSSSKLSKKVCTAHRTEERVGNSLDDQLDSAGYVRVFSPPVNERPENNGMRSRDVSYVPVFGNPHIPNTGRGLGTGPGAIYFCSNNNQRSTPPSTVIAARSSVPHKDASVSDRKGKGIMVQSDYVMDYLPDKEVPQKPKTPFQFDLNETYEEDTSLEESTNAAREEDTVPVRSEQQNPVETLPPRQRPYMPSPSVINRPHAQDSRRSSILFPGHNPQWMGNIPMATPPPPHHHHHHPSPSMYPVRHVPHQYRAPYQPNRASSSMMPPQYHHHLSPHAPFNMDYSRMFAQAPNNNLSCYGASLMNQAMMSHMDPRFRSNTPVNHNGNIVFTPRHVHPVNQFNQCSHESAAFPRMSNQGRHQRPLNSRNAQRRNAARSSNASRSPSGNGFVSSVCIVSQYPAEIADIEPGNVHMVPGEDLHVPERMSEFEMAEDGPVTKSG